MRSLFKDTFDDKDNNSCYELLLDWVQPYNSVHHSVGVLAIKCADLDPANLGKAQFIRTVAVIPGPNQPAKIRPYLERTMKAFNLHASHAIRVEERLLVDGKINKRDMDHRMFLTGVHADSPARQKVAEWPGQGAYLACGFCDWEGQPTVTTNANGRQNTTIYYKGYEKRQKQNVRCEAVCSVGIVRHGSHCLHSCRFAGAEMLMSDRRLQITDEQHMSRARAVAAGTADPKVEGRNGLSCVPDIVEYVSYSNVWVLPVAHCILYGIVASYVDYIFRAPTRVNGMFPDDVIVPENRQHVRARALHIFVPSDYGRKYKCVEKYRYA